MRWLAIAGLCFACTQPRSERCKDVCHREAECVTATTSALPFDEKECIAACSALEADQNTVSSVEQHVSCVNKQTTCAAVLDCH